MIEHVNCLNHNIHIQQYFWCITIMKLVTYSFWIFCYKSTGLFSYCSPIFTAVITVKKRRFNPPPLENEWKIALKACISICVRHIANFVVLEWRQNKISGWRPLTGISWWLRSRRSCRRKMWKNSMNPWSRWVDVYRVSSIQCTENSAVNLIFSLHGEKCQCLLLRRMKCLNEI